VFSGKSNSENGMCLRFDEVYPDTGDLSKRSLLLESEYQIVEIKNLEDGDIHEGVDFYVRKEN
jgi:hypothetical protein